MSEVTAEIIGDVGDRSSQPAMDNVSHFVLIGGDSGNPSWEDYLADYKEEYRDDIRAIRKAIEAAGLLGTCADNFCNYHWFKLSNGHTFSFSWRAWGDLMQAIVNKREGYMAYYMGGDF